eukprot:1146539-Pelagomonas_calceolata.AAC.14
MRPHNDSGSPEGSWASLVRFSLVNTSVEFCAWLQPGWVRDDDTHNCFPRQGIPHPRYNYIRSADCPNQSALTGQS